MGQPEAPPVFCRCPPPFLSLVGEEKLGLKAFHKAINEEARDVQGRLMEQLSQLTTEVGLFLRLMYKNKNQHRRSLYYRRLLQVRRDLQMLNISGLQKTLENFTKLFNPNKQDSPPGATTSFKTKDSINANKALQTLLGVARLLNQMGGPIIAASVEIAGLLGQSFFMPFALTMLASLARFRVLLRQVLYEVITAFNLLSALLQHKPGSPLEWSSVSVGHQSLPAQLECRWEGSKLFMTERKPCQVSGSFTKDSDNLVESAELWYVDDRTGKTYDLQVPVSAAGLEPLVESQMTLDVNLVSLMIHEADRVSTGSALEEALPHISRLDPLDSVCGTSYTAEKEIDASNLTSGLPFQTTAVCSKSLEDAQVRESSSGNLEDAARNMICMQGLSMNNARRKPVAYISIHHRIAPDNTDINTMSQKGQVLQHGIGGFVESRTKKQEENGLAVTVVGSKNGSDRVSSLPYLVPSSGCNSTQMVESPTTRQDWEDFGGKQEFMYPSFPSPLVVSHKLKSAVLDMTVVDIPAQAHAGEYVTSRQDHQIEGKQDIVNPSSLSTLDGPSALEDVDMQESSKSSMGNLAEGVDSYMVQITEGELRTSLSQGASDFRADSTILLVKGSKMTGQHTDTEGGRTSNTYYSTSKDVTLSNSGDVVASQVSSYVELSNMAESLVAYKYLDPTSVPVEEKLQASPGVEAYGATYNTMEKLELEEALNRVIPASVEETRLQRDLESADSDRPEANDLGEPEAGLSAASNLGLTAGQDVRGGFYQQCGVSSRLEVELTATQNLVKDLSMSRKVSRVESSLKRALRTRSGDVPRKKRKEDGKKVSTEKKLQSSREPKDNAGKLQINRESESAQEVNPEILSKKKKIDEIFAMLLGGHG